MSRISAHVHLAVTTAVFSTCGMGVITFSIAAILSLPKQFITVYLGVALEQSEDGTPCPLSACMVISDNMRRKVEYPGYHHQGCCACRHLPCYHWRHVVHLPPDEQGQAHGHIRTSKGSVSCLRSVRFWFLIIALQPSQDEQGADPWHALRQPRCP